MSSPRRFTRIYCMISFEKSPVCTDKNNILQAHKHLKKSDMSQISGSRENVPVLNRHDSETDSNPVNKDIGLICFLLQGGVKWDGRLRAPVPPLQCLFDLPQRQ